MCFVLVFDNFICGIQFIITNLSYKLLLCLIMKFPVKFIQYKTLKYPKWSELLWLSNNILLVKDNVNFALIDIESNRIYQNFPDLHSYKTDITVVFISRCKQYVILLLNTSKILIFDLKILKVVKIYECLPKQLQFILNQNQSRIQSYMRNTMIFCIETDA